MHHFRGNRPYTCSANPPRFNTNYWKSAGVVCDGGPTLHRPWIGMSYFPKPICHCRWPGRLTSRSPFHPRWNFCPCSWHPQKWGTHFLLLWQLAQSPIAKSNIVEIYLWFGLVAPRLLNIVTYDVFTQQTNRHIFYWQNEKSLQTYSS